ncbi:MAG: Ig-like domain-containing protein, partial [Flavobacteriales bacterium]|nr:Ig-like domain-containing protein [Flavobacteriales bacterium]
MKKLKSLVFFAAASLLAVSNTNAQSGFTLCGFGAGQGCPGTVYSNAFMNSNNNEAQIEYDNFVSSFHSTIGRQENGGFRVWGEDMGNNGTADLLSPLNMTSANYPALGSAIPFKAGLGSSSPNNVQGILLASDGLYAWGSEGEVLDGAITSSTTFQKLTINGQADGLPVGVDPADVKMMFVTYRTIAITTCGGDVWVISQDGNNRGNGNSGNSTTWYRVTTTAAGNPFLTNIVVCRGAADALFALDASGNLWTWGENTYSGGIAPTGATDRSRAFQMQLPTGVSAGQIKMIGMTTRGGEKSYYVLAKNGNLYALGENSGRQLGDWTTTDRTTWIQPRYTSAAGPVMNNIYWISPQEHDDQYGAINVLTNDSSLYAWGGNGNIGLNARHMIGRGTAEFADPGIPDGFIAAGGLAIAVETGGHTSLIIAPCRENFGYVGHRVNGSMGNGDASNAIETQYTFATAPITLCGAPGLPQINLATPPFLGPGGFYCSFSSIELIFSPPNGTVSLVGPGSLVGNVLTFAGPGSTNVTLTYTLPPSVCGGPPPSVSASFTTEDCFPVANFDNGGSLLEDSPGGNVNILTNDTDPSGNPTPPTNGAGQFTIDVDQTTPGIQTSVTTAQGNWSYNPATGIVNYVPAPNFNGPATIIYNLCDPDGLCDTAVVLFTVTPVNDPPTAVNDTATTNEDTPVTLVGIHLNDTDIDGVVQVGTIDLNTSLPGQQTSITNAQGTWTVNLVTGNVLYTPAPNFNGTATLPYSICDNGTPLPPLCATANLIVTVVAVNDPPVANADNASTNEDTPVTVNVLGNDTDLDGSLVPASVAIASAPTNGSVSVNPVTGAITYTPNPNFNGTDSFIYQVCDNGTPLPALCDTAVVTITVNAVNDLPNANADFATTAEDTPVNITLTANDNDVDGNIDPTTVTVTSVPSNGSVSVDPVTGVVTYTPNPNFNGIDTFIYQVCDDGTPLPSLCDTALVTITVNAVNDPPLVNGDNATTPEDTPVVIDVLANDTDIDGSLNPASVAIVTGPSNGTVSINPVTGAVTYTPNANYNGPDSFIYNACDNGTPLPALCDTALVTINVTPVNDAPIANNDVNSTPEDTPVSGNVSTNDSDVDGPGATYTLAGGPSNGSVTVNPDGTYTYTPNANFTGTDSFTYSLCDGGTPNLCDTATVTVTVTPVNDPPLVNGDNATTPEDTPVVINVLANDTDIDGSLVPASVAIVTGPSNGTVSINPVTGAVTYTPNANYNGPDSFIYNACDNGTPLPALCDTALVTINVTPVNDAPVANNDVNSTPEDTPVSGNVSTNDSDVDG